MDHLLRRWIKKKRIYIKKQQPATGGVTSQTKLSVLSDDHISCLIGMTFLSGIKRPLQGYICYIMLCFVPTIS